MNEHEALQAIKEEKELKNPHELEPGLVVEFDGYPTTVATVLMEHNKLNDLHMLLADKSPEEIAAILNVNLGDGSTPLTTFASYIIFAGGKYSYIDPHQYVDLICFLVEMGMDMNGMKEYLAHKMEVYTDLVHLAANVMSEVIDECIYKFRSGLSPKPVSSETGDAEEAMPLAGGHVDKMFPMFSGLSD